MEEGDHPISADGLNGFGIEVEVCVLFLAEETPNAGLPFIGSLNRTGRRPQLNVVGATGQVPVDVAVVQGVERPPHRFDILL